MQCFISPALYGRKVGIIDSVRYSVRKGLNKFTGEEILAFLRSFMNLSIILLTYSKIYCKIYYYERIFTVF